jgi:hypothetical protein
MERLQTESNIQDDSALAENELTDRVQIKAA